MEANHATFCDRLRSEGIPDLHCQWGGRDPEGAASSHEIPEAPAEARATECGNPRDLHRGVRNRQIRRSDGAQGKGGAGYS